MNEQVASSVDQPPIVFAITGASGAIFAVRTLQHLLQSKIPVHLTISPSGAAVIQQELKQTVDLNEPDLQELVGYVAPWTTSDRYDNLIEDALDRVDTHLNYYRYNDYMTPMASGSFRTAAMIVCPCSGSTLSGIARAAASNLIQRAAEVHLKEHRKLVIVPRETPVSVLQLENLQRIASAGAVVLPAMPGWYHDVQDLDSLVDFIVSRILDQLDLPNQLVHRWGS